MRCAPTSAPSPWFDKYLKPKPAQHTLLISDHGPNGEIAEIEWPSGKVLWKAPNDHGHDVQALPERSCLVHHQSAEEGGGSSTPITKRCGAISEGLEHPIAAQRLANGNTLISDARLGKVIEVTPGKQVVWKYESADLANMRSRNAHRTEQGTTLIAVEAEGEADRSGRRPARSCGNGRRRTPKNRKLYMGRRLANGNTVMSLSRPGRTWWRWTGPARWSAVSAGRTRRFRWAGRPASRSCRTAGC